MERDKRKKSKMPCLFGGNGENANHKIVHRSSPSDGITEQNLFTFEVGQTSSKQGYGTPMKTLLAKEMSNETSAKKRSPSLIAKLMGLDGLPSPQPLHRQQRKLSGNSHKSTSSVGDARNEKPCSHQSDKKSTMEQQQFKDVYEDLEASHVANHRYSPPVSAKRRSTKQELGYIQERCDEMLRESIAIKSKLERVDSNSDLMLSFLQKPDSLFVKHLHDQQGIPSGSPCNQITVLKPSNSVRHGTHGKGLKEDRETLNYRVPISHQRNDDWLLGYSSCSINNSHRSSRIQLERNEVIAISPTRIVVLKPNIAKIYNDKNSVHSSDECRKNAEMECFSSGTGQRGSQMYRGPLGEVRSSRHKSREAREIARQITSQMKKGFESGNVNLFDHGFRGYAGDESLYNMSTSVSASESEMMVVPSRNSFDRSDRPKHSPSNISESSVIREAKKRMSQRWKTHGYKDVGMVGKGSTLEEMLSVPNSEMRHAKTELMAGLVGVSDEYVSPAGLGMHLGISSKDGRRDGYLRNTSRSRSLPPSLRNRSHRTSNCVEAHADEKIVVHNESLHRGKSKGAKGNFNHIEDSRSKTLRYHKRCRSSQHCNACSPEFANSLTENHSIRKPTETYLENDHAEQEPLISDIHGATTNAASVIDVIRISSGSSNELIPGLDVDSSAIDEDSSDSQKQSTAKSGVTVSVQLSGPEAESSEGSKEVDQRGQISVLEVPLTEDVSSGSDCFERVSSQLHELRKQLHMLKMESGSTYDSPNEEEVEQGSWFTDSDSNNWESSYLTDLLQGSGFYDNDPYTFMITLYATDCPPIDSWLFDDLEKKYSEDSRVSRSERHLLYDRVKEALFVISKSMVSFWWGQRGIQMEIGLEKQLQNMLAKQEKEAKEDFEEISIDKDLEWFQSLNEMEVVGKQIAEVLVNELVLEIVTV